MTPSSVVARRPSRDAPQPAPPSEPALANVPARRPSRWFRHWPWLFGVALIVALARYVDWPVTCATLQAARGPWLAAALGLFVPQTLASAWRWRQLAASVVDISRGEALRQVLKASAWNLLLPAKTGDLGKAAMLPCVSVAQRTSAALAAIAEKLADVGTLVVLAVLGLCGLPAWMYAAIAAGGIVWLNAAGRRTAWLGWCPTLWLLHLAQFYCLMHSVGISVTWNAALGCVPWAIFAGLLPISPWGVGTRDAALVYLFADVASAEAMVAVGLLASLRYLLPGLAGAPLVLRSASCSPPVRSYTA